MVSHSVARIATLVLLSIALIFVWAALGGSEGKVAWSYRDKDPKITYGLLLVRSDDISKRYADNDCSNFLKKEVCEACRDSGSACLSFLVFAMLGMFAVMPAVAYRLKDPSAIGKIPIVIGLLAIEFCFFLIWVTWAGGCQKTAHEEDSNVQISAGWALIFLNFILFLPVAVAIEHFIEPDEQSHVHAHGSHQEMVDEPEA
ncbi:hypothetical protein AAMO2058_000924200 [Amorphochlora amoebiformis]